MELGVPKEQRSQLHNRINARPVFTLDQKEGRFCPLANWEEIIHHLPRRYL